MKKYLTLLILLSGSLLSAFNQPTEPVKVKPPRAPISFNDILNSVSLNLTGLIPVSKEFVPTFTAISYYYPLEQDYTNCKVFFRKKGQKEWQNAFMPVMDKQNQNCRGSIVNLVENTKYEIKAEFYTGNLLSKTINDEVTTWAEKVTVAKTLSIHEFESTGYKINVSGTSDGWIKIIGDGKPIIADNSRDAGILVDEQKFLILENLVVKGGYFHGIKLENSSNIRIINCDISDWGRKGRHAYIPEGRGYYRDEQKRDINNDAGISMVGNEKIVVDRCYIHDPAGRANPWYYAHPRGPNAIHVGSEGTNGNYVIRYNDFVGSDLHRWNDVVEGWGNANPDGSLYRDSDVYGNFFSLANDDGIELDGGEMNLRIFGNKFVQALCGISTAPNMIGPSYIYRNVIADLGDESYRVGSMIKNGGARKYSSGLSLFFNNTYASRGNGIRSVGFGEEKDRGGFIGYSRNNVLVVYGKNYLPVYDAYSYPEQDFDYDLLYAMQEDFESHDGLQNDYMDNGKPVNPVRVVGKEGLETNAIFKNPEFVSAKEHRFDLKSTSPAIKSGQPQDNFCEDIKDLGAYKYDGNTLIPFRPVPIFPDKNKLIITDIKGSGEVTETVSFQCNKLGPEARSFEVRINDAHKWIRVEPMTGTLPKNGKFTFNVKINRELCPYSFKEEGSFIVKLKNGYSIPVMVSAEFKGAESIDFRFPLTNPVKSEKGILKDFTVLHEGIYYFYMKASRSDKGTSKPSYQLSLNQGESFEMDSFLNVELSDQPEWIPVEVISRSLGKSSSHRLFLDQGVNQILFKMQDDMNLEEILITTNPYLTKNPTLTFNLP